MNTEERDEDPAKSLDDWVREYRATADALHTLLLAGNSERLEQEARRFLEKDPEDLDAHFYLAAALIDQKRNREAWPHIRILLREAPEDTDSHLSAAIWYRAEGKWHEVAKHAEEGLRLNPDLAVFHYFLALYEAQRIRVDRARKHVERARQLDPNDAEIADLAIRLGVIGQDSAADAWKSVEEYREALKLDPQNAKLHNGIGDIFLEKLDRPRDAERHYREALRSDPRNHDFQRDLFKAVASRSLIYRLVSLPSRSFEWIGGIAYVIGRKPWWILLLVVAIKAVMIYLAWLTVATLVFWLPGKIYEWLLVTEIKAGSGASDGQLRWWFRFQRVPMLVRFALFLGLVGIGWSIFFWLLSVPLAHGFTIVGFFAGVHFVFVLIAFVFRRIRSDLGRNLAGDRGDSVF